MGTKTRRLAPEGEGDFLSPPPALGGKRYFQDR